MESVVEFARAGGTVLGICNGFQILCEAGLLPGALLPNSRCGSSAARSASSSSATERAFTNACEPGRALSIPVKHTTGLYAPPDLHERSRRRPGGAPLRDRAATPTARTNDIAGVCNEAGNVFGLMPHPEHAVDPLSARPTG